MIIDFLNMINKDNDKDLINFFDDGDYGMNPVLIKQFMRTIKDGQIPLVMNENDKSFFVNLGLSEKGIYKRDHFISLSDIVAVHVSAVPPVGDMIKTPQSTGFMNEMVFVDPSTNIYHTVPYLVGNDTIHFTLNCVVQNHESGNNWNGYKYGILVDFESLDKTKVLDVKGEDTYVDGDAKLGRDYFLFCPLDEREKVEKNNPGAIIIEYSGITLAEAISCMIVFSGRKLEPYGTYGWGKNFEFDYDLKDSYELEKLVVSKGYPVLKGMFGNALHSETKYMARRMWKREYEALISLIKYNQENNINMPDEVVLQIMQYGRAYSLPGTVPVSLEDYKKVVFPILEKYGYYVDDSLFEGIKMDNNMKIIYFLPNSNGFPIMNFPNWEIELRNRVIKLIKNSFVLSDKKTKSL